MTAPTDISPGVAGLQTRLVIETITQVVSGAEIVEIVGSLDETIPGFDAESWSKPALTLLALWGTAVFWPTRAVTT